MNGNNIIRNLMLEIPSAPGNLGKVTTAIGLAGGDIGEIETIKVGPNYTMRNITVQVEHEEQLTEILEVIRNLKEGIHLHTVSDDVLVRT